MADQGHKRAPSRRPGVHHLGAFRWRVGVFWRAWLIGAQYDFMGDCWMLHLGPFAVRVWRASR